ncbi:hypothetical protein ACFWAX_39720, partial [Streptomyces sp. NPDC059956]
MAAAFPLGVEKPADRHIRRALSRHPAKARFGETAPEHSCCSSAELRGVLDSLPLGPILLRLSAHCCPPMNPLEHLHMPGSALSPIDEECAARLTPLSREKVRQLACKQRDSWWTVILVDP